MSNVKYAGVNAITNITVMMANPINLFFMAQLYFKFT